MSVGLNAAGRSALLPSEQRDLCHVTLDVYMSTRPRFFAPFVARVATVKTTWRTIWESTIGFQFGGDAAKGSVTEVDRGSVSDLRERKYTWIMNGGIYRVNGIHGTQGKLRRDIGKIELRWFCTFRTSRRLSKKTPSYNYNYMWQNIVLEQISRQASLAYFVQLRGTITYSDCLPVIYSGEWSNLGRL